MLVVEEVVLVVWYHARIIHVKNCPHSMLKPGPWSNIKMPFYQYRKSHCGDKTVVRSSYLYNGISYTGKMASLYWIGDLLSGRLREYIFSLQYFSYDCNHYCTIPIKKTHMTFERHHMSIMIYSHHRQYDYVQELVQANIGKQWLLFYLV